MKTTELKDIELLFIELLQVSVGTREVLSHTPTDEEWQELYKLALSHTLSGVVLDGTRRLPAEQQPPRKLNVKWYVVREKIRNTNLDMDNKSVWVTRRWKDLGYGSVILKGQGNAQLYPEPHSRMSGDIDVLVLAPRNEIAEYIHRKFPKEEITRIEADFPVLKDTCIEVHFAPAYLYNPITDRRLNAFFDKELKQPKTIHLAKGPIQIPNDRMNLVFQLTHIYRHLFFEGIGLRQLMDYYFLLQKAEFSRSEVQPVIESINLKRFCRGLMWVLHEVFALEPDDMLMEPDAREGRFLLKEIMRAGNFGRADSRVGNWAEMSRWQRLTWGTRWGFRLLQHYPQEVLWQPVYRITQYLWRLRHGYLGK